MKFTYQDILSKSPTVSKKHYNDIAASHNLESGTTTTMRDLVARESEDGECSQMPVY